jgi:hypothetical protein
VASGPDRGEDRSGLRANHPSGGCATVKRQSVFAIFAQRSRNAPPHLTQIKKEPRLGARAKVAHVPTLPRSHRGRAGAHRISQLPPHQNSMLAGSRPSGLPPLRAVRAVLRKRRRGAARYLAYRQSAGLAVETDAPNCRMIRQLPAGLADGILLPRRRVIGSKTSPAPPVASMLPHTPRTASVPLLFGLTVTRALLDS